MLLNAAAPLIFLLYWSCTLIHNYFPEKIIIARKLTAIVFVRIVPTLVGVVAFRRFWDALPAIAARKLVPVAGHEHGRFQSVRLISFGRGVGHSLRPERGRGRDVTYGKNYLVLKSSRIKIAHGNCDLSINIRESIEYIKYNIYSKFWINMPDHRQNKILHCGLEIRNFQKRKTAYTHLLWPYGIWVIKLRLS